ncbi:MAG: pilus assembly protein PilA [Idiomarina sp.]|nr:pilus assembly protein PilA [Idiomarina sp.]
MIVIAILGILSSIAVPAFTDYTQRARASTALMAMQPWQTAIALCWQQEGTLAPCHQWGTQGIPAVPSPLPQGLLSLAPGAMAGSIRAQLQATDAQGQPVTIELTPLPQTTQLQWQLSCSDHALGARVSHCQSALAL